MAEVLRHDFTLDEALSSIGFGYFHVLALFYAGLGWASNALGLTLLSIIGPAVKSDWGLSSGEESMLSSVVFAAMLVGANFFGYISDAYGRRMSSIGTIIATGMAIFFAAFSPTYEALLLVLTVFGFGAGGSHVFASWFLEFAPLSTRGSSTVAISLFYSIGNILAASLAWIIMPRLGWRWLVTFSSLPPLLVLLLGVLVPESPRYLYTKGRSTDAFKVLERVALFNRTKVPLGILVSSPLIEQDEEYASSEESPLDSARKKTSDFGSHLSSVFMLFSPKLLKTTFLLSVVYFGSLFAYYGMIFLTSELSGGLSRCASHVEVSENSQDSTSYEEIFINSLAEVPSALIAAAIVDRVGRKLSLVITSAVTFIFLVPLVWHQNDIVTTVFLFGARLFISTGTMVLAVYASEVYPTSLRSTGVGVATSAGYIGSIVCPLVAVVLVEGCHQGGAIALFEVVVFLTTVAAFFLPVETNGKELVDIIPSAEEESCVTTGSSQARTKL